MRPSQRITLLMVFLLTLSGCNRNPPVGKVEGKITVNGTPISGGKILFLPLEGGIQGIGKVRPDGTFTVGTFGSSDGALVGQHHLMLINVTLNDNDEKRFSYEMSDENPVAIDGNIKNIFEFELAAGDWQRLP